MKEAVLLPRGRNESMEDYARRMAVTFAAQCPPEWWGKVTLHITAGGVSHIEILRTLKP